VTAGATALVVALGVATAGVGVGIFIGALALSSAASWWSSRLAARHCRAIAAQCWSDADENEMVRCSSSTNARSDLGLWAYFARLQVPVDASYEAVKEAYHRAVLRSHPDKGGCAEQFRQTTDAYEVICQAKHWPPPPPVAL